MHVDDPRLTDAAQGPAAVEFDTRRHGALVQIGSAPRRLRGQTDHRHGWNIPVHDDANVGRAAHRDVFQRRVPRDPFFQDRAVGSTSQRIQPGEDGREMVLHVGRRNFLASRRDPAVTTAVGNDQDSASPTSLRRFDDEVRSLANQIAKFPDISLPLDNCVGAGDRDAVVFADLFRQQLVVHSREVLSRVMGEDIRCVASVHAENSGRSQFPGPGPTSPARSRHGLSPCGVSGIGRRVHACFRSTKSRNRHGSNNWYPV